MARTVEQILKQQLGGLLAEIAVLTATNEALVERITELEKAEAALKEHADGESNT